MGDVKIKVQADTTRNMPIYRPKVKINVHITPFWRKDNDSKKER